MSSKAIRYPYIVNKEKLEEYIEHFKDAVSVKEVVLEYVHNKDLSKDYIFTCIDGNRYKVVGLMVRDTNEGRVRYSSASMRNIKTLEVKNFFIYNIVNVEKVLDIPKIPVARCQATVIPFIEISEGKIVNAIKDHRSFKNLERNSDYVKGKYIVQNGTLTVEFDCDD